MAIPFYIAKRYAFSKSKTTAINIITLIASFGIITGTTAMLVVLSVFSGLRDFSLSFSNAIDPDFLIEPKTGKTLVLNPTQINQLAQIKNINYSFYVDDKALLVYNGKEQVIHIKGVDSNFRKLNQLDTKLFAGKWFENNSNEIVMGAGIVKKLSVGLFDYNNPLNIYVPKPGKGLIENPDDAFNQTTLITAGMFQIKDELDDQYIFCTIKLARELLNLNIENVSGIELTINGEITESELSNQLNKIFPNAITIKNKEQINQSLYRMLNTENLVLYLILTLVIIIFLFSLIGALIMMIIEKKNNLKTLYNLGVTIKELKRIFLYQGNIITLFGGTIGLILGGIIIFLQQNFRLVMITENLAYPVKIVFLNFIIVFATITVLGFIASKIASSTVTNKLLK